jgi:hypothetical protein
MACLVSRFRSMGYHNETLSRILRELRADNSEEKESPPYISGMAELSCKHMGLR